MADGSRRFPPPWRVDTIPGGYVVRDASGQAVAHVSSPDNEDEARQTKVLTKDEARRIAVRVAQKVRFCSTALMQAVIAADSSTEIAATINVSRQVICER
jgi:hypothetical protein